MSNTRLVPGLKGAGSSIRRLLGGIVLATALATVPAHAADLPVAPIYKAPVAVAAQSWTGFYAGLGIGFRSSVSDPTVTGVGSSLRPTTLDAFCAGFVNLGGCVTSEPLNDTAFRVSPYVGFNWQISPIWVVGVEGDVGFASKNTTLNGAQYPVTLSILGPPSESFSVKTTWDASARLRLGVLANPSLLFYATGGPAWMHIESSSVCSTDPAVGNCLPPNGLSPSVITHSSNKLGWTAGGGAEAMLWSNWFLRGEYRYSDFGTISNSDVRTNAIGSVFDSYNLHVRTHTTTLGLAYRFWGDTVSSPASVATRARAAAVSWSGPYLGLGAGVRSSRAVVTVTQNTFNCAVRGGCFSSEPFNDTAGRVSPYIGWNWQFAPQWVAGVEGDFGFADKTTTLAGMYYPSTRAGFDGLAADQFSLRANWDASIRARVGYLVTPANLVYLTGGASWLRFDTSSVCSTNQFVGPCAPGVRTPSVIAHSDTKPGWTIGGGFESRLWQNWTARAEYRYADYGRISQDDTRQLPALGLTDPVSYESRVRTHTFTLGVAYQFDWANPVVAKY